MYSVVFSNVAAKALTRVSARDKKLYSRLIAAIENLKTSPYSGKALKGKLAGDFSLRVGDFRVVYTVRRSKLMVYVIDLGHRKEIYR